MAIRVSHAPISAYGRAAYQGGQGIAAQRRQELSLERQKMMAERDARNKAFALQDAAGHRAERTMMSDLERRGRLDEAGFEKMREQKQMLSQNLSDWEKLSGEIPESEFRRGIIAIRQGKVPTALKGARQDAEIINKNMESWTKLFDDEHIDEAEYQQGLMLIRSGKAPPKPRKFDKSGPQQKLEDDFDYYSSVVRQYEKDYDPSWLPNDEIDVAIRDDDGVFHPASDEEVKFLEHAERKLKEVTDKLEEMRAGGDVSAYEKMQQAEQLELELEKYMLPLLNDQDVRPQDIEDLKKKWKNSANHEGLINLLRDRYGTI